MDAFLQAFEEIDEDCSGEISVPELRKYMKKKNYEEAFVTKWLQIFDMDSNGSITLEEFCDTLGLVPRQDYIDRVNENKLKSEPEGDIMDGVRIINVDPKMTEETMKDIVRIARKAQNMHDCEKDIAKFIKQQLDLSLSTAWHVVVGRFRYGSFVSHEPGCLFHFWVLRFAIIVWKTPDFSNKI